MTASRLLEKQQSQPAQTTVKLNGAFHAPPPAALPARRSAAKAGRGKKRTKGACGLGRLHAPFFCLQFRAAACTGLSQACQAAWPIEKKPAAGNSTGKKCRTRRVAEKGETCRFHAFKVVLE